MHKVAVAVLGASGYAGRELCSLLARHPSFDLAFAAANEQRGTSAVFGGRDIRFVSPEDVALEKVGLVFTALPHGTAAVWVDRARGAGAHVVDLSSDFRPGSGRNGAPYGLTELVRPELRGAELVANPGCYPTAVLLALAPLLERGLVRAGGQITVNAASGVTGAGSAARADPMFSEVAEDFRAYGVGNEHRHVPEMRATIARLGGDADIVFTPHLLPVARGILATINVPLTTEVAAPMAIWREFYANESFIELTDSPPSLRDVVRRNVVRIAAFRAAATRTPSLVVLAAIDNLMKGAAGQALQNANVVFGVDERAGLPA